MIMKSKMENLFCHICPAGKSRAVSGQFPCCIRRLCAGTPVLRDGHDQDQPKLYRPSPLLRIADQAEAEKRSVTPGIRRQRNGSRF